MIRYANRQFLGTLMEFNQCPKIRFIKSIILEVFWNMCLNKLVFFSKNYKNNFINICLTYFTELALLDRKNVMNISSLKKSPFTKPSPRLHLYTRVKLRI